jgi:HlyD family secretion protein
MKSSDTSKNLTNIVNGAATRPLRKWLFISLALALLAAVGYYLWTIRKVADTGPKYVTRAVTRGDISLDITATGNLAPINEVIIGSELSGTVQEVYVEINDVVKKAQPLAKLDTAKLTQQTERSRATLSSAKARVSQTQATLHESEAAYARLDELHQLSGGKTPSRATIETSLATVARAKADLESASATVSGAEAELRSIQRDLEKTIIRSPVDGIVLTRTIEVGQTVAASFTAPQLFMIAEDLKKMKLRVAVAEADIGRLAAGQTATFKVDAWPTRVYDAKVKKVFFGSVVTNNVVTYTTELTVDNDDLSLRPGMTATADISLASAKEVLIVANSALRFDPVAAAEIGKPPAENKTLVQSLSPGGGRRWGRGGGAFMPTGSPSTNGPRVWTLKDGKPCEVFVKTGLTDGSITEITEGPITQGQELIVSVKPTAPK